MDTSAAVSPRWRGPKQFSRPPGCFCAARSFHLAVVVSFRVARNRAASGCHVKPRYTILSGADESEV